MTNEELDRLEALANAATPGPWVHGLVNMSCKAGHKSHGPDCEYTFDGVQTEDFPGMDYVVHQVQTMRGEQVAGNYDYEAGGIVRPPDAAFIAAARDAVPALIAEVRRLRGLVEAAYAEGYRDRHGKGDTELMDVEWERSDARKALEGMTDEENITVWKCSAVGKTTDEASRLLAQVEMNMDPIDVQRIINGDPDAPKPRGVMRLADALHGSRRTHPWVRKAGNSEVFEHTPIPNHLRTGRK